MVDQIKEVCGDHPITLYSLLDPAVPLIKTHLIKTLRYVAIAYKKLDANSSWRAFANLDGSNVDTTAMQKLVRMELVMRDRDQIAVGHREVAARLGVAVNEQGSVDVQDDPLTQTDLTKMLIQAMAGRQA